MLLNAIIIDDEPKNIRLLKAMIAELLPSVTVKGDANNVEEGIQLAKTLQPHIIFLDIRISGDDDGFTFFNAFKQPMPFEVIFVTAHDKYLTRAFNQTFAAGYILKPIDPNELVQVVYKVKQKILAATYNASSDAYHQFQNVLYCYIKNQVVKLKLVEGKEKFGIHARLEDYEKVPFFFRINRQCVINLNFIKNLIDINDEGEKTRNAFVSLFNGEEFSIAYSRKAAFIKTYKKFVNIVI